MKSIEILYNKSLHGLELRHADLISDVSFMSSITSKRYEINVNACFTVTIIGGISSCNGVKMEKIGRIHLHFRSFLCIRIEIDLC